MNNLPSNWSLRFPRTSREAFGHQAEFRRDPDHIVGLALAFLFAFVAGMMVGGAL